MAHRPRRCPHCGALDLWYWPLDWFHGRWWWGCLHCGWMDYAGEASATGPRRRAYHTKKRKKPKKAAAAA